eukprot:m.92109 g.92109  ORF g.92109 m.92109 type:complete len:54 (+) comp26522_c2_seq2:3930-4091(+)
MTLLTSHVSRDATLLMWNNPRDPFGPCPSSHPSSPLRYATRRCPTISASSRGR